MTGKEGKRRRAGERAFRVNEIIKRGREGKHVHIHVSLTTTKKLNSLGVFAAAEVQIPSNNNP